MMDANDGWILRTAAGAWTRGGTTVAFLVLSSSGTAFSGNDMRISLSLTELLLTDASTGETRGGCTCAGT